jgi:hypothetical protein
MDPIKIDNITMRWGDLYTDVAAKLRHKRQYAPYKGWQNIRCDCHSIYGLKATEFEARAPIADRPVMQVSYRLAPLHSALSADAHAPYLAVLQEQFGPPLQASQKDVNTPFIASGSVIYSCHWLVRKTELTLSVFGGVRHYESGKAGAALFLDWRDIPTAAKPFADRNQQLQQSLAATLALPYHLQVYEMGLQQYPFHVAKERNWIPEDEWYALNLALYTKGRIPTPAAIKRKLSTRQMALYQTSATKDWYVANHWETVRISAFSSADVTFGDVHSARGAGRFELRLGDLTLRDDRSSLSLHQLKRRIESILGFAIKTETGIDD